uniref:Battenin n=1 Tax=Panagrellus redivivus TaxID=6233 RepID=A0A7E4UNW4_PANRE
MDPPVKTKMFSFKDDLIRNLIAFWVFGLCNNYAYVIMLSAAEDIMDKQEDNNKNSNDSFCDVKITETHCSSVSTGAVLLADILPTLVVKLTFPFFMHRIPFGIRHLTVVLLQAISYFIVAYSQSVAMSLTGVVFASLGAGLGEITYLALSAHFTSGTVSAWSSGTGGAGVIGSFAYAALTEPKLANLSPKDALLAMLVVPALFALAYWFVMVPSPSIHKANPIHPKTWLIPVRIASTSMEKINKSSISVVSEDAWAAEMPIREVCKGRENYVEQRILTFDEKLALVVPLLKYMLPLATVYIGEYLINQGLTELIYFDCSHSFHLSRHSQYRWYQVLYQVGVFLSRSSVNLFRLPRWMLFVLPVLQITNAVFFAFDAVYFFIPHIWIVFIIILFEGLLGGSSYVNTFDRIHSEVAPDTREYSMSIASLADSLGVAISGFTAIPLHNFLCNQQRFRISS